MNDIKFRLAKPSDAKQIANCHWHVRDRYTKGIFLSLGVHFLETYYKIVLDDPWEVVVCAEQNKKIVGFSMSTIDAHSQAINLRKHKIRLGFAALGAIICKPTLLKEVWQRYKSLDGNKDVPTFVHTEGARGEYWCWSKEEDESYLSVEVANANDNILYELGIREIFFEVDKFNKAVYKYHLKINQAIPIEDITLPDGRERTLFKKILSR